MEYFKKENNAFSFVYDKKIPAKQTVYLKMPAVTPNKRGVNDIGFAYEEGITLYATLAADPLDDNAIWQEIMPFDEINKTVSYIKIKNDASGAARVNIRALLN